MVLFAPKRKHKYDEWLEQSIGSIKNHINTKNDDHLILVVGDTGTGKSHLSLHMFEQYLGEEASIDYCGLNKQSIATALKCVKEKQLPRCFWVDEANISKRSSLSKFNKDMVDLYSAIRGLNIFHIWCNPSLNMLDKFFIEERIKGIYFITSKDPTVRVYYYFKKENILKIYNKYGHLKLPLLRKVRKKYAYYRGWFQAYDGKLLKDYEEKKDNRMEEKVEHFFEKWGNESKDKAGFYGVTKLATRLGIHEQTAKKYIEKLIEEDKIDSEHIFTNILGINKYSEEIIPKLEKIALEMRTKRFDNLKGVEQ